jgi:hypothetical protein
VEALVVAETSSIIIVDSETEIEVSSDTDLESDSTVVRSPADACADTFEDTLVDQ